MSTNDRFTATIWAPLVQIRIGERRRSISQATVELYRQWLEQGREAPPVRLARQGDLFVVRDGHHRVAAASAAGHTVVKAVLQRIAEMLGVSLVDPSISFCTLGDEALTDSFASRRSGFDSRRLQSTWAAA